MSGRRPWQAALLLAACMVALPAVAADHVVVLKKRAFEPETISIKVGDNLVFRNDDPIDHNVSSQSAAKVFEIETLAPGQSQKVAFDKAGTVEIGCSMHDAMHLTIQIAP